MATRAFHPLLIAVLATACGSSTPDAAGHIDAPATGPLDVDNACLDRTQGSAQTAAADPRVRALKGRWLLQGSVEGESRLLMPDSVGIEINEDGRFRELGRNADGALVRKQGFDVEGRISFDGAAVDAAGRPAGQIAHPGNGFLPFYATVDAGGRTLHIDAYKASATFVATDETPVNRCPSEPGARLGAAACDLPEASIHFDLHADEIKARLPGRWVTCSVERGYGDPPRGYEFTADGHWYTLVASASGALTRGEPSGTVDVIEPSGSGAQVNLVHDTGTQVVFVSFSDSPVKLRVDVGTAGTTFVLASEP